MKKNIMKRAWEIARQGQKIFGGSVKMYFSESLKQAWNEYKQGEKKMELSERDNNINKVIDMLNLLTPAVKTKEGKKGKFSFGTDKEYDENGILYNGRYVAHIYRDDDDFDGSQREHWMFSPYFSEYDNCNLSDAGLRIYGKNNLQFYQLWELVWTQLTK